jgi:hypothetical protein
MVAPGAEVISNNSGPGVVCCAVAAQHKTSASEMFAVIRPQASMIFPVFRAAYVSGEADFRGTNLIVSGAKSKHRQLMKAR